MVALMSELRIGRIKCNQKNFFLEIKYLKKYILNLKVESKASIALICSSCFVFKPNLLC